MTRWFTPILGRDSESDAIDRLVAKVVPPDEVADQRELGGSSTTTTNESPADQRLDSTMHHYSGLPLSEVAMAMGTACRPAKAGCGWRAKN